MDCGFWIVDCRWVNSSQIHNPQSLDYFIYLYADFLIFVPNTPPNI